MGRHGCRNVRLLINSATRTKETGLVHFRRLWVACRQTDSKKSIWEKGDLASNIALVMFLNPNIIWVGGAMNEQGHTCAER